MIPAANTLARSARRREHLARKALTDGATCAVALVPMRGERVSLGLLDPSTELARVRELAAQRVGGCADEVTLVAGGRRLGEAGSGETVGDLAWAPLGAVDREPLVLHVVRRPTSRTMRLTLRHRRERHAVVVKQSDGPDELRRAGLAALESAGHRFADLRLVHQGTTLDAAAGLPLVEYGIDDGATILAVPSLGDPRAREVTVRVKVLGAPATLVSVTAAAAVKQVKLEVARKLPKDMVARCRHLATGTSQVFLGSRAGAGAQRMGDEESLGLHRLEDGAAAAVLFLVPPANRVQMSLKLGPLQTNLVSDKEDLVGLAGCYADQLATCRKELQAQLAREEADARVEARRQARRQKRLGKGKARGGVFARGFLGRGSATKRAERQRASAVAP